MSRQITIDGPCAAGKTSTAKALAALLPDFIYVDTGAFYRAIACYAKQEAKADRLPKDIDYARDIVPLLPSTVLPGIYTSGLKLEAVYTADKRQTMIVNDTPIPETELRDPAISQEASKCSTLPAIRAFVNNAIRAYATGHDIIMEGRDTGSVILPHADVKFYLTAEPGIRTWRRMNDIYGLNHLPEQSKQDIVYKKYDTEYKEIQQRDERDMNRTADPLVVPQGAIYIDNTTLSLSQTVTLCQNIIVHLI